MRSNTTLRCLGFWICFLFSFSAFAQCPVASSCTPGIAPSSAYAFGMDIFNVAVGSGATGFSNPTSGGVQDGYQDYSCTKKATVLEGVSTAISVTTNANANENVRVWVDLNNDGSFAATSELVFSSNNAKIHTGTFTIPISASVVKNTVLRMRVSADNFSSPIPTPCSTPAYSQVEDYGITVLPNTNKPAVDFTVNSPITCSPTVQFTNLVQNGATSYLWNFGDGTTSTAANPSHTYAATGTYPVKLKACNANGCDSLTKTNYVTYHTNVPIAASCTPTTTSYCCGYGITKVTFHTLVNTSQDGSAGYEDFTCSKSVSVEEGLSHLISIQTGQANNQDTWVYIDYNSNGSFSSNELVFSKLNQKNPNGQILIPIGLQLNVPLRMRIISDALGGTGGACTNQSQGQTEDYTVIIIPNTRIPVAGFKQNKLLTCGPVQFNDTSQLAPTSWIWNFGDAASGTSNTSTLKNPTHTFSAPGNYNITLIACNAFGCDTITKNNLITVSPVSLMIPASCQPQTLNYCCGYGINGIDLNNGAINSMNGNASEGYQDYSCSKNAVVKFSDQQTLTLYIYDIYEKGKAWIDYNNNGIFEASELIMNSNGWQNGSTVNFNFPPNVVKNTYLRMRVMSDAPQFPIQGPCNDLQRGQAEDYAIKIIDPPVSDFVRTQACTGVITFTDSSKSNPTSWLWNFGDTLSGSANTSTIQNPTHTFTASGTYRVSLITCNSYGCDTTSKYLVIGINNSINLAPVCIPQVTNPVFFRTIYNVTFAGINNTTSSNLGPGVSHDGFRDYKDYSCAKNTTLIAGNTYPISISTALQGYYSDDNVQVWIDFNNDNSFSPTEKVFQSLGGGLHRGSITIPTNSVRHTFLRMRVRSEDALVAPNPLPSPCSIGYRGETEDYAVMIVNPTGITENNFAQQLNIYPNPSHGTFSLEIPSVSRGEIQLEAQDLTGKTVAKQALKVRDGQTQQVDLSQLPKGMYLLKVYNAEVSAIKKMVLEF